MVVLPTEVLSLFTNLVIFDIIYVNTITYW